jgi:hypothetical protein
LLIPFVFGWRETQNEKQSTQQKAAQTGGKKQRVIYGQ